MSHTYRYDKYKSHFEKPVCKNKFRHKSPVISDGGKPFFLPTTFAQKLLTEVLERNSRAFLLQNPLNDSSVLYCPQKNLECLIKGETHFKRNSSYLAGHISQTHSFIKGRNGELLLFKGREKGVFYLLDKRNYLDKISNPSEAATSIVQNFIKLPTEICKVNQYEDTHFTHMGTHLQTPEGEIKEFTHKITFTKDFKHLDVSSIYDKNLAYENLPSKFLPLQGVGLALNKKDIEPTFCPSLSHLEPATQVSMVIQITKDFYRELSSQVFYENFSLDCLPWEGNALR